MLTLQVSRIIVEASGLASREALRAESRGAAVTSIFNPLVPAGAYDEFAKSARPASAGQRTWTESDGALPALYIGHGAPPLLDDAEWMTQLAAWTHAFPKPKGVLIVSAHWEAAPLMLSAPGTGTPLVYDFGGFKPRY